MKKALLTVPALLALALVVQAETLKLKVNGAFCGNCAKELNGQLKSVASVKVTTPVAKGKTDATIEMDLTKADVGEIGKKIAEANTPHKAQDPPGASLVLEAKGVTAEQGKKLGDALKTVKGVDAAGSSHDATAMTVTIKLDKSGEAKLADIKKAIEGLSAPAPKPEEKK